MWLTVITVLADECKSCAYLMMNKYFFSVATFLKIDEKKNESVSSSHGFWLKTAFAI